MMSLRKWSITLECFFFRAINKYLPGWVGWFRLRANRKNTEDQAHQGHSPHVDTSREFVKFVAMVALLVACIQPTRAVTLSIELVTSHHRLVLKLSWRKKRDGGYYNWEHRKFLHSHVLSVFFGCRSIRVGGSVQTLFYLFILKK